MSGHLGFGFSVFPFTRFGGPREMAEVVQLGEELGFEALMLPEHLLVPHWAEAPLSTKYWYDLPTLAAYLAGMTTRLKFITGVLVVPYHPPIQLAKALATLDVLSGGRVMLGVGAGWMKAEFRRLRIPFAERAAITDEYLRAMRELWTSDAPHFEGRYVSFDDVSFFPRPLQPGGIPYLVGGSGPRPLRRVAELGDGWFPMTASPEAIRVGLAVIREQMAARGRDSSKLWVGYTGISLGADPETAAMRRHVGSAEPANATAHTPAEAIAGIRAYQEARVNFVSIGFAWSNAAELAAGMRHFAAEIMPAFR